MKKLAKFLLTTAATLVAAATVKAATVVGPISTVFYKDEGVTVSTTPNTIDFVGSGVTVTKTGVSSVTVTIAGGGGVSVYPATATASFPFGFNSSTLTLTSAGPGVLYAVAGSSLIESATSGTINTSTNPVDWTLLKNVPVGFSDGVDNTGGGLPLTPGDTNYIQNTNTLQSGATFYTSSGTVSGILSILNGSYFQSSAYGTSSTPAWLLDNSSSLNSSNKLVMRWRGRASFDALETWMDMSVYSSRTEFTHGGGSADFIIGGTGGAESSAQVPTDKDFTFGSSNQINFSYESSPSGMRTLLNNGVGDNDWRISGGNLLVSGINASSATFTSSMTLSGGYTVQNIVPVSGQVLKFDGTNWAPGTANNSGGGSSSLEVFNNFDATRSSPTASIGLSNAFRGTVSGSTYTLSVNFSSVASRTDVILNQNTLQTGATYYVSSGTVIGALTVNQINDFGSDGKITVGNGSGSPGFYFNSNSVGEFSFNGSTFIISAPVSFSPGGAIRWPDGTIQVSSPTASAGATPGGSTTQVQYNNGGSFAGDEGLKYDPVGKQFAFLSTTTSERAAFYFDTPGTGPTLTLGSLGISNPTYGFYFINSDTDTFSDHGAITIDGGTGYRLQLTQSSSGSGTNQVRYQVNRTGNSEIRDKNGDLNLEIGHSSGTAYRTINNLSGVKTSTLTISSLTSQNCIGTDSSGNVIAGTCGGGASILAVGTGTATNFTNNVTSPTAAISFHGDYFRATTNGTTSFITLAPKFSQTYTPLQIVTSSGTLGIQNSTTTRPMALYDASAHEWADWQSLQLKPYSGGALSADIAFTMASATSGGVTWSVQLECIASGASADYDTASFDTFNSTSGATVPATAGYLKVVTVPLTNNDSCASGDSFRPRLNRLPADSGDTASGDAEFRWMRIYE